MYKIKYTIWQETTQDDNMFRPNSSVLKIQEARFISRNQNYKIQHSSMYVKKHNIRNTIQ